MASDNDDLPPFWYPFSLQFESTKREREFQTANEYLWHLQDTMGLGMAIFVAPIIVFELGYLLPLSFSLSFLFLSFGMAPLTIYIILRHRELYQRLRFWVLIFSKLGVNVWMTMISIYVPIPTTSIELVSTLIFKSGTSSMLFSALMMRIPFNQFVVIHTIALIENFLWIPPFCSRCETYPKALEKFDQMASGIDRFFSWLPFPVSYQMTCPCWIGSAFVMIVAGYVVPMMIVFTLEVFSRSVFLHAKLSQKYEDGIENYAKTALNVAFRAFVVATVAVWYILSMFRDISPIGEDLPHQPSC